MLDSDALVLAVVNIFLGEKEPKTSFVVRKNDRMVESVKSGGRERP
jgi:hypothetical protein